MDIKKAEFLSPLKIQMLPEEDNQRWFLLSPLSFYSAIIKKEITVPAYFITDLVSFFLLKGKAQRPSVVHDFLYACNDVPRELADRIFKEAMRSVGVESTLKIIMYRGVRTFGNIFREKRSGFYLFPREEKDEEI